MNQQIITTLAKEHGLKIENSKADDGKNISTLRTDFDLTIHIYHNKMYAEATLIGRGIKKGRAVKYNNSTISTLGERITKAVKVAKDCKERSYN